MGMNYTNHLVVCWEGSAPHLRQFHCTLACPCRMVLQACLVASVGRVANPDRLRTSKYRQDTPSLPAPLVCMALS